MAEQEREGGDVVKGKRGAVHRSPAYPSIDLKTAIERAKVFYAAEKRAAANVKIAAEHWGYSFSSSGGKQAIAALIAFGLMEDEGSGDQRKVKLTDLALRIILDERPDSKERDEAIRRAALMPKIHQEILAKWPTLPSDANLRHYLILDRKFNENVVNDFIRELKSTIALAKLQEDASMSPASEHKSENYFETEINVEVGDLVQWESNGVLQLPKPVRVRQIMEHEGSSWVFVEGSQTGIPMDQVSVVEKGQTVATPKVPPVLPLVEPTVSTLEKHEREWLRGPLSKETNYRLIVSGDIGPKEIGKLIRLLEAQKAVLADEDDENDLI